MEKPDQTKPDPGPDESECVYVVWHPDTGILWTSLDKAWLKWKAFDSKSILLALPVLCDYRE